MLTLDLELLINKPTLCSIPIYLFLHLWGPLVLLMFAPNKKKILQYKACFYVDSDSIHILYTGWSQTDSGHINML